MTTIKRFYIDSPNFKQTALVMQAFKKTYADSIEKIFIGHKTGSRIVLKPEGGIQNEIIFAKNASEVPRGTNTINLDDFIKHYFSRKNPLTK